MDKRNIVLITLESIRADYCSFMGYHRKTTPILDRMAREGLYFENAIAPSVPTAPSTFSCFTGQFPLIESLLKTRTHGEKNLEEKNFSFFLEGF